MLFVLQAQTAAPFLEDWTHSGVGHLRVELVDEPAGLVQPILEGYRAVLLGEKTATELWGWLKDVPDSNGTIAMQSIARLQVSM